MIDQARLDRWKPLARRDDWHMLFVGSDIRVMLAEIEKLQVALKFYADAKNYEINSSAGSSVDIDAGETAKEALNQ